MRRDMKAYSLTLVRVLIGTSDWFTWQMILVIEIIFSPSELQRYSCLQFHEMKHIYIPPWPHFPWYLLFGSLAIALYHSAYSQDPAVCTWFGSVRLKHEKMRKAYSWKCRVNSQDKQVGASCEKSLEEWAPEPLVPEAVSKIHIASLFHYPEVIGGVWDSCDIKSFYIKFFTVRLLLSLANVLYGWGCLAKWDSWGLTDVTMEGCNFFYLVTLMVWIWKFPQVYGSE